MNILWGLLGTLQFPLGPSLHRWQKLTAHGLCPLAHRIRDIIDTCHLVQLFETQKMELRENCFPQSSLQIPVPGSSMYSPYLCVSEKAHGANKFLVSFSKTIVLNLWVVTHLEDTYQVSCISDLLHIQCLYS